MQSLRCTNVNDAFPVAIRAMRESGVPLPSRNGPVLEYPEPYSIMFDRPCSRVLFDKKRAINPFLHFFEPLWILAGQDDVKFLADIVPRFYDYSDNHQTFYGAYGKRLLFPVNQIRSAIEQLKANHDDRRVVLVIRQPEDINYSGADQPCNVAIAFKIRNGKLNMHVFNRSNDLIWGMLGANVVQFSTLQEYMALRIGVPVGVYHQTTDSMHVYTDNPQWDTLKDTDIFISDPYILREVEHFPLSVGNIDADAFDWDLSNFFEDGERDSFVSTYFRGVVKPMWQTFMAHKEYKDGLRFVHNIDASDWRFVTKQWLFEKEK